MLTEREARSKYRGQLRAAVHHARKGNATVARHFYAMAQGVVSVIGAHTINLDRLRAVGWIVGTIDKVYR